MCSDFGLEQFRQVLFDGFWILDFGYLCTLHVVGQNDSIKVEMLSTKFDS